MGVYSEYLDTLASNPDAVAAERKKQLKRIADIRGHDVLAFAADLSKQIPGNPAAITYMDILPITDQLSNLHGKHLDLILETPGGVGEVTEEIVRIVRSKYESLSVIVPGWAKSAGTILAMAADEILMGPTSALGPIDAQLVWQGKQFSADALLEGVKKIKKEVQDTGVLNKAYVPILQNISPGELEDAQNARDFATDLVTDWLAQYKFKLWTTHSSNGQPVTAEERKQRAKEIADQLCDHARWRTHGRSIKLDDLKAMRLHIMDYREQVELADAITRNYALLQITFSTNVFKIYETPGSQIVKFLPILPNMLPMGGSPFPVLPPGASGQIQPSGEAKFNFQCGKRKTITPMQANFGQPQPIEASRVPFPKDNKFQCPGCGIVHDLSTVRKQLEAQAQLPVV